VHVSGERAGCLRRVMVGKEFACENCGSGSFIIKSVRWSTTSPLALEVASNCASCGTGGTRPRSRSKRPGAAASTTPSKAPRPRRSIAPVRRPRTSPNRSFRPFSLALIHRSACKGPYSITYAERLAWHCPPGAHLGSERVTKMLKARPKAARSGPKSTSLSETTLSDAVEQAKLFTGARKE
jgi:hypothetical protein